MNAGPIGDIVTGTHELEENPNAEKLPAKILQNPCPAWGFPFCDRN
jgi:hypothetical protein